MTHNPAQKNLRVRHTELRLQIEVMIQVASSRFDSMITVVLLQYYCGKNKHFIIIYCILLHDIDIYTT